MAKRNDHVACARALLGSGNPLVHAVVGTGPAESGSRYWTLKHLDGYLDAIEMLFGTSGKREAVIHFLLDWGVLQKRDYLPLLFRVGQKRSVINLAENKSHGTPLKKSADGLQAAQLMHQSARSRR